MINLSLFVANNATYSIPFSAFNREKVGDVNKTNVWNVDFTGFDFTGLRKAYYTYIDTDGNTFRRVVATPSGSDFNLTTLAAALTAAGPWKFFADTTNHVIGVYVPDSFSDGVNTFGQFYNIGLATAASPSLVVASMAINTLAGRHNELIVTFNKNVDAIIARQGTGAWTVRKNGSPVVFGVNTTFIPGDLPTQQNILLPVAAVHGDVYTVSHVPYVVSNDIIGTQWVLTPDIYAADDLSQAPAFSNQAVTNAL